MSTCTEKDAQTQDKTRGCWEHEQGDHSCTGRPTIFRVPEIIRRANRAAYEPNIVSLGPYHHKRPPYHGENNATHLKAMYKLKKDYQNNLIKRNTKKGLDDYGNEIKQMEHGLRSAYSEEELAMTSDEFVEMMLLDGCFVVELLLRLIERRRAEAKGKTKYQDDPIVGSAWGRQYVLLDVLLLENQLPLVLLERLLRFAVPSADIRPRLVALVLFANFLPGRIEWSTDKENDVNTRQPHHILHLLHSCMNPPPPPKDDSEPCFRVCGALCCASTTDPGGDPASPAVHDALSRRTSGGRGVDVATSTPPTPDLKEAGVQLNSKKKTSRTGSIFDRHHGACDWLPSICDCWASPAGDPDSESSAPKDLNSFLASIIRKNELKWNVVDVTFTPLTPATIPCATKLKEAGVAFKLKEAQSFMDITFRRGRMEIPRLRVHNVTDPILRNLVAFEQLHPEDGTHVTDYAFLMDCIINTPEDVALLREKGIVVSALGSDKEVAVLFNSLCKNVVVEPTKGHLKSVFEHVPQYCKRRRNVWRATLNHNYFGNPWATISFIAAICLFILTLLQTSVAVISYLQQPHY